MATLRTDELNSQEFDAAKYITNYFKPMEISDERKKVREEASEDFREVLLFLFALISAYSDHNIMDWAAIQSEYRVQFEQTALKYARNSKSLQEYVDFKTSNLIAITRDSDLTDPYWTSDERATKEAVNNANSVITGEEWQKAIDAGAVQKRWKTQNDEIVRKSHRKVNRVSVGIDRFFILDRGMLRYPGDEYYSKEESINCRCGLDFLDADGKVVGIYWTKRGKDISNVNSYSKVITDYEYVDKDGQIYTVDGKHVVQTASEDEKETAAILAETYGYDVHLVPRVLSPQGIKTPDYLMDNRRIDRKQIDGNGKYVLDNAVKNKRDQANEFVYVLGKTKLTLEEVEEQARAILKHPHRGFIKKIYIEKDKKIVKVIEK